MKRHSLFAVMLAMWSLSLGAGAGPGSGRTEDEDILLADFEGSDYGAWKAAGEAFGAGPARGTLRGQMVVSGYEGKGLVNTFLGGDGSTGSLTSPEFLIARRYLAFLLGGGKDPERLALELLVDGKVVRTATGPNDRPGGSEELAPGFWDVSDYAGRRGVLRIRDEATGPWGHLNVDAIVLTDRRPAVEVLDAKRSFVVEKRYLNIPIKNGARKRKVTLQVDGEAVVRNEIELADGEPDWWAAMDVSAWRGKEVALVVDRLREDSRALEQVAVGDRIVGAEAMYREPLRGQFHFSPKRGWNNDPNGLVSFNGEYHLFFQHNPYGWGWGNMHWGHAVSKDLVHWEELGDVLMPDALGAMFSGSAVVDWKNTSGLGSDGKPPLVLIYTAAGDPTTQCIASSTDGRHFTKYARNPVVKQVTAGNRDPKVMWHAPSERWVMVLYVELEGRHTIHFLTSADLKEWTLASVLEGGTMGKDGYLFECPDFFELAVEGQPGEKKWVLLGANSEYAIGTFDGTKFHPEQTWLAGQRGRGFYAPQTFSDIPAGDGRRIQIGWFQTETPGMPFNQSMTIAQELKLSATPDGPRLMRIPIKELEVLREKTHRIEALSLRPDSGNPLGGIQSELLELEAEIDVGTSHQIEFTLRGATVAYDSQAQELEVNGHRAPAATRDGRLRLRVFVDRTGLEVFATDGLTYVPMPFLAKAEDRTMALRVSGGEAKLHALAVHELRTAWENR